jgi:hypothetical protein
MLGHKKLIKKLLDSFIESIALILFLVYIQSVEMHAVNDWLIPYLIGSVCSLITSVYFYLNHQIANRIFLGIGCYFYSGFIGVVLNWDWLNQLYGQLEASALLLWIFAIGLLTTLFSPYGFLGKKITTQCRLTQGLMVDLGSIQLLIVCLCAIVLSFLFHSNRLLGEWIPFILLFTARNLLFNSALKQA